MVGLFMIGVYILCFVVVLVLWLVDRLTGKFMGLRLRESLAEFLDKISK